MALDRFTASVLGTASGENTRLLIAAFTTLCAPSQGTTLPVKNSHTYQSDIYTNNRDVYLRDLVRLCVYEREKRV